MKVIAHRGACREKLENSWSAFNRAVEIGADRIELDVVLTKDQEVMVMHDTKLERTTGLYKNASDVSRKDCEKIKLTNGEAIPFLDEVIEKILPNIEINVEIKGDSVELAEKAARIVKKSAHARKVIFSSFNLPPLEHIANAHPDLSLACLVGHCTPWPYFGHKAPPVFMARTRAHIIHPWSGMVTEGFMDQAKARHWTVYPWCEMNGEEESKEALWANLHTLGIDGLCTNYPREFKTWLSSLDKYDLHDLKAE